MGGSYLVTEAYEGTELQDKSTSSGKSYQFETYNLYIYDTNQPNKKPRKVDLVKLAKDSDKSYVFRESDARVVHHNGKGYVEMPFGPKGSSIIFDKIYYNLETGKLEEGDFVSSLKTLESQMSLAHIDLRESLKPFGLWTISASLNAEDDASAPVASQPSLYYLGQGLDGPVNLAGTNMVKEYPEVAQALAEDQARVYTRPNLINQETWFNTFLHWLAPEGQEAYGLSVKSFSPYDEGTIHSYKELEDWNSAHGK